MADNEQRRALAGTVPTAEVIRDAVTFPRDRLGEPLDISGDRFDAWLARVRRDAWDACYHQMVTAPARGVIVTEKSNPYAPERRETP